MRTSARLLRLAMIGLTILAMALPAAAQGRRVALVIGNGAYPIKPLANPESDARAVAKALEDLRFDKVILKLDQTRAGMVDALQSFQSDAEGADVVIVYFAGHGTELSGRENYLVPVDAKLAREADLADEAIPLSSVLTRIEGARELRLVILDACRNPPFALGGSKRGGARGLAKVEPEDNTLIAYSTKDGTTADDGDGAHSPFTAALLKHIGTAGLDVRFMFGGIRDDVLAATGRRQQPYLYGTLGLKQVMLAPAATTAAVLKPEPAQEPTLDKKPPQATPAIETAVAIPDPRPALEKQANAGDVAAMKKLAWIYQYGSDWPSNWKSPVDLALTRHWLAIAADRNDAQAMWELANMHEIGVGGPKDLPTARKLWQRLYDMGNADGTWRLGKCYQDGQGCPIDAKEARRLFKEAAQRGLLAAMSDYAEMLRKGEGGPIDYVEARNWLERCTSNGFSYACRNALADMYEKGQGGKRDQGKAKTLREWIGPPV